MINVEDDNLCDEVTNGNGNDNQSKSAVSSNSTVIRDHLILVNVYAMP